jgi:flagellar hook-associated protein 3 FlgL
MLTNQFLSNYNSDLSQVTNLEQQISTGLKFSQPSDDPVGMERSLQMVTDLNNNSLYQQNVSDAISWMQSSSSSMSGVTTGLSTVSTLISSCISATDSSTGSTDAQQVKNIIDQLVQLGNTQVGGRYIFSGQADNTQPFTYDASGNVVYNGTYDGQGGNATAGTITMQVSPGPADPVRNKINVDGVQLFGAIGGNTSYANSPQIFGDLQQVMKDMQNGNTTNLTNDLGTIQTDINNITSVQASLGARQSSYTTIKTNLTSSNTTLQTNLSDNQDLDVAKASITYQEAQNVYEAALTIGAKILPQSLVNYLGGSSG